VHGRAHGLSSPETTPYARSARSGCNALIHLNFFPDMKRAGAWRAHLLTIWLVSSKSIWRRAQSVDWQFAC